MTKTFEFVNIPNGDKTDAPTPWEVWRHQGIDAEDAAVISGENPWETREELLVRKAQPQPVRKPATPAMVKGKLIRPHALNAYRSLSGIHDLRPASIQNLHHPWMIAHPDLMRGYHIAEVHSGEGSLKRAHQTDKLPRPYWAEAQHTLMVSGYRKMTVYLHNADPAMAAKTFEVFASPQFQEKLLAEEKKFLADLDIARKDLEKAAALHATIQAITGKGPRVSLDLFHELIPTYADRKGNPTPAGRKLLELTLP